MKPFIEFNAARDEWAGEAVGLFVGPFCLLGVLCWRGQHGRGVGLVMLNVAVGLWSDE